MILVGGRAPLMGAAGRIQSSSHARRPRFAEDFQPLQTSERRGAWPLLNSGVLMKTNTRTRQQHGLHAGTCTVIIWD
jgi:hypothetical protein